MKTKLLFLFILLSIFTCKKSEDTPTEDYAFDDSIFGEYLIYYADLANPLSNVCNPPETLSVVKVNTTGVSVRHENLTFEYEEDDVFLFNHSTGSGGYQTTSKLRHYPCADSIVYSEYNNQGGFRGYGKKINGKICLGSPPSEFEPIYCDQGPDNVYCYSFVNTNTNISVGSTLGINYLSTDSTNQTIQIGISESMGITLPTDSSYELLTGDYWLGDIPSGGKLISDLFFQKYFEWSVYFQDFKEGHLNVSKSGDIYTISFNFTCQEGSKWTGYYSGAIN